MTMIDAIATKIIIFCSDKKISINEFSLMCNLTQSTVNNIVNRKTRNIKMNTVLSICYGMNISIEEFYKDEIFKNIIGCY